MITSRMENVKSAPSSCEETLRIVARREFSLYSPLRYPGGKAKLAGFLRDIFVRAPNLKNYVEPYAGGAGAGVALLLSETIRQLHINDFDPAVYSFWTLVKNEPEVLTRFIELVTLDVDEWRRQRAVYQSQRRPSRELGLAFFYLNRTNRSGILNAGVIGGLDQTGKYKLNARFNRKTLVERVEAIRHFSDRIIVTNQDGRDIIDEYKEDLSTLLYIDPPYVEAGSKLYLNAFDGYDHVSLAQTIHNHDNGYWIVTYDDVQLIRDLYKDDLQATLSITYSAHRKMKADEILIASKRVACLLPGR